MVSTIHIARHCTPCVDITNYSRTNAAHLWCIISARRYYRTWCYRSRCRCNRSYRCHRARCWSYRSNRARCWSYRSNRRRCWRNWSNRARSRSNWSYRCRRWSNRSYRGRCWSNRSYWCWSWRRRWSRSRIGTLTITVLPCNSTFFLVCS